MNRWLPITIDEPRSEELCLVACTSVNGSLDFVAIGYRNGTDDLGEYWILNDDYWDGDPPVFWLPLPLLPEPA